MQAHHETAGIGFLLGSRRGPIRRCRFLTTLGRTTLLTLLVGGGWFIWMTQQGKHPGQQLSFDEGKKTLVVLGSGWGTTPLLKTLDTEDYNVIVMSPKNFLFAPLLPSIAVGTLSPRSILQPTRYLTRSKKRGVAVIDAEATKVDAENRTVTFADKRLRIHHHDPVRLARVRRCAEVQTFGIKGVQENACFMKEIADAEKMQRRFMDCLESAGFMEQSKDEIDSDLRGIEYENCLSFHDLGLIIGVLRVGLKQGNKTINSKDFLTRNPKEVYQFLWNLV
ncbi:hypothetical protein C8J56DRAFT_1032558 [Mycena floridula]|nr:hypothetical protein C8J56DRAFT_1032558 [Mycena floridula]